MTQHTQDIHWSDRARQLTDKTLDCAAEHADGLGLSAGTVVSAGLVAALGQSALGLDMNALNIERGMTAIRSLPATLEATRAWGENRIESRTAQGDRLPDPDTPEGIMLIQRGLEQLDDDPKAKQAFFGTLKSSPNMREIFMEFSKEASNVSQNNPALQAKPYADLARMTFAATSPEADFDPDTGPALG